MADVITDGLEGKLSFDQLLDTSMAERVCAWPTDPDACFTKVRRHGGRDGGVGDWRLRGQHTEEYVPILRLRPAVSAPG